MDGIEIFNRLKQEINAVKNASNNSFIDESLDSEWSLFERFSETLFGTAFDNEAQMRVLSRIGQIKSNRERIELIFENKEFSKLATQLVDEFCQQQTGKNEEQSKELRLSGNKYYGQGKFEEALDKYNQAIDLAPYPKDDEEKELSFSFANRSATFFHLHKYNETLEDIKAAINLNYPLEKVHILVERLIQCFDFLHLGKSIKDDVEILKKLMEDKSAVKELKEKVMNISLSQSKNVNITKRTLNTTISEYHETINGASNAVQMNYSQNKGRFIESNRDIKPSEVIFSEDSFVHWLKPSYYKMFCGHCLKNLVQTRFVSCKYCSEIRFCSNKCFQFAWDQYHKYECKFFHFLKYLSLGALSLKAILTVGIDTALKQYKISKIPANENLNKPYLGNYNSILNLVEHSDKCQPNVIAALTSGAVFLGYLVKKMAIISDEKIQKLCELMLQHIFQFNCNTIAVLFDECESKIGYQTFNASVKPIAMAIYPTICLLNHCCYSQVYVLFNSSRMTLKSVGNLKSGEEISFCYGPHFQKMTHKDRQEMLEKCFYFKCECKACINIWENLGRAIACTKCNEGAVMINDDQSNYCLKCNASNDNISQVNLSINQIRQLLTEGYSYLDENEVSQESILKAKNKYSEALVLEQKYLYKSNDLVIETNEKLADCYSQLGNHKKAMLFWFKCYESTKEVEGDDCSYDCLFYLLKITEGLIEETDTIAKHKILTHLKKAENYFAKAVEVSSKLSGKEYKLLVARHEILQNVPKLEEIACKLHQLNVVFTKNV